VLTFVVLVHEIALIGRHSFEFGNLALALWDAVLTILDFERVAGMVGSLLVALVVARQIDLVLEHPLLSLG